MNIDMAKKWLETVVYTRYGIYSHLRLTFISKIQSKVCDMYGIRVFTFTLKKECHSDILMSTAIVVDELGTQGFITSFSDFIT